MATVDFHVGQHVELSDGRPAVVRFVGETAFKEGIWIGVELEDHSGKNDGSVAGTRYFDCEPKQGVFVLPTAVRAATIPDRIAMPPPPKPTMANKSRPSTTVAAASKRLSATASRATTRQSMNAASPTPTTRRSSSMLRSPSKSPTKQLLSGSNLIPSTVSSKITPASTRSSSSTGSAAHPSMQKTAMIPPAKLPPSRVARQSLVSRAGPPPRPTTAQLLSNRPSSTRVPSHESQASLASISEPKAHEIVEEDGEQDGLLSPSRSEDGTPSSISRSTSPIKQTSETAARPMSSTSTARSVTTTATSRIALSGEVDDLKTKLRLMEKKRMEDREKLKMLDQVTSEKDKFEGIIQKLQAKYQPLQQVITDLRKQLKDSEAKVIDVGNMQADHDDALEMATLDREMAEETAEVLKMELDALKQKAEELELEVEILREENEELGGEMSAEDKASQGWLQMERNNERLREALLKLRDLTQETEAELRGDIKALEQDNAALIGFKERYQEMESKLTTSEAAVHDLRQQLDNALGAEDMIEELTERTMTLNEQVREMRSTIEDFETLKELNDELEINHIETQKELQKDLDDRDDLIAQQVRHIANQSGVIDDMEYTLSKFRELVRTLQSDLEDMQRSHAVSESESEHLNNRSKAMLDLNLKLQVSAAKTQSKTIDLELRRLDAQEASDHLAIVQLFLPESFQTNKDSILALLRFKRIAFKADLLKRLVKERALGESSPGHEDETFIICDVMNQLSWTKAMCDRFVNFITHCTIVQFAKFEGALYELEPVERALNGWIDGLRQDELKAQQCALEIERTNAVVAHLAEVHFMSGLEFYADDIYMRTTVIQSKLESMALALTTVKSIVGHATPDHEGDKDTPLPSILETIHSATRSAVMVSVKVVRSVEDLKNRSLSLSPVTIDTFERCQRLTEEATLFPRKLGLNLFELVHDIDRTEVVRYSDIVNTIHQTTKKVYEAEESTILSTFSDRIRVLTTSLSDVLVLTNDLSQTQEFERAPEPWVTSSQQLKQSKAAIVDATEELARLRDVNREKMRIIALRDQMLEESAVKVELLESRMRDANKKTDKIHELEGLLSTLKNREAELSQMVKTRDKELMVSEQEKERLAKLANNLRALESKPNAGAGTETAVATAREMQSLQSEIAALQTALSYLREDNRISKISDHKSTRWLEAPLLKKKGAQDSRKDLLVREGNDALLELLGLCGGATHFDLGTLPEDRLAWKPFKATPSYHVGKQRQNWAAWRAWSGAVSKKGQDLKITDRSLGIELRGQHKSHVKFDLLDDMYDKSIGSGEVHIIEAGDSHDVLAR